MITPGETWLSYMGVPDAYPDVIPLALEVNDAMWEAASDVLRQHLADNPVLRAMRDDRYRLWELVDVPVGSLPPGIEIVYQTEHRIAKGVARAPHDSYHPPYWANVDWDGDRWSWHPSLRPDDVVQAWLPVPLDVSALIAVVAAETNQPVPRPPRRRPPRSEVNWATYAACNRRGCWATERAPCIDVRSAWTTRRRSSRPHPGRPRITDQQLATEPDGKQ